LSYSPDFLHSSASLLYPSEVSFVSQHFNHQALRQFWQVTLVKFASADSQLIHIYL